MKDLFSTGSQLYQQARPSYPQAVLQEILKYVPAKHFAWDAGAGSGQFTQLLTPYFDHIVATDISANQLQLAPYFENVSYQVQAVEKTSFAAQSFDLITAAQAIHWFDFEEFYQEVYRTLKPDGILAVIGYGMLHVEHAQINQSIHRLYFDTLNGYWDTERRYIDESYTTIPFPFEEIEVAPLKMQYRWTSTQLLKYLSTWSAVKHYQQKNDASPLVEIAEILSLQQTELNIEFPILLRLGRLKAKKLKRHKKILGIL